MEAGKIKFIFKIKYVMTEKNKRFEIEKIISIVQLGTRVVFDGRARLAKWNKADNGYW